MDIVKISKSTKVTACENIDVTTPVTQSDYTCDCVCDYSECREHLLIAAQCLSEKAKTDQCARDILVDLSVVILELDNTCQ